MRVLHLAAGNLFGGIERMLLAIAVAAPEGTHVVAVSYDGRLARTLRAHGVTPHVLGAARFSRPDTIWRTRRALRRLAAATSPDAIVAHAPWSCALAAPVARRAGLPLFLWVHDAPRADQFLERRVAAKRPDTMICNSAYTARLAAAWLPDVPREIIHPAVPAAAAVSADDRLAIRRALDADDYATVIFMAARLEPWKGHRLLLEAVGRLRGSLAVWIAGGPQRPHEAEYLASLRRFADAHLPPGRVRFLGERDDVPALMAAADIYCQPNTAPEPFGVVFVEALAAGVPVVTSAMGGAVEIVDDRCGTLVDDVSAEAFAAALQRLVDDRERRAWLGAAGPERAARLGDAAARVRQIDEAIRAQRVRSSAA